MDLTPVVELTKWGLELARRMFLRWYITVFVIFVCVVLAIGYARRQGPQYTVTMKVIPAELLQSSSGGSSAGSALSGASSLLGINLGGGGNVRMSLYLDLLQSPAVAQLLVDKYHLDKILFKGAVDPKTNHWKESFARKRQQFLYGLFGLSLPEGPSVQDVAATINGMLVINGDSGGAATKVDCVSGSPKLCRDVLLLVDHGAQTILNKMATDQATSISKYLSAQIPQVRGVEAREAMASMLAAAQREIALSSVNQPTVAAILEQPRIPSLPTFPDPRSIITLAIMVGIVFGAAITWFTWSYNFRECFEAIRILVRERFFRRQA